LLLSSLASFFAFLVQRSRVCRRFKSGLPRSAALGSVVVRTFGASQDFGKMQQVRADRAALGALNLTFAIRRWGYSVC
jgi:hypothetical protein